eukprot:SAG31_NODE_45539_length_258_cov_0.968553_1_plen_24_part_01
MDGIVTRFVNCTTPVHIDSRGLGW